MGSALLVTMVEAPLNVRASNNTPLVRKFTVPVAFVGRLAVKITLSV